MADPEKHVGAKLTRIGVERAKAQGLSMFKLAAYSSDRHVIWRWLNGHAQPRVDVLERMLNVAGLTLTITELKPEEPGETK